MSSSVLDKMAKVLARAENAATEGEAEVYMARALAIGREHSIELAVARRHVAKTQKRETPETKTIDIGAWKAMGNTQRIRLFVAISQCNDLLINCANNNTYIVLYGFPSDIEVAETLYAHLAPQMVAASSAFLATGKYKNEMVYNPRTKKKAAPSAKAARLAFYDAFVKRVTARLLVAQMEAEQAVEKARLDAIAEELAGLDSTLTGASADTPAHESVSTALVLADKKAEVNEYYERNNNATGNWKPRKPRVSKSPSASRAGTRAGTKARLSAVPVLPEPKRALAS